MEVRVKKLVWSNPGSRYIYKAIYYTDSRAESIFGSIVVRLVEHCDKPKTGYPWLMPFDPYYTLNGGGRYATFEEAAEAAQARHDKTVLSALEIVN